MYDSDDQRSASGSFELTDSDFEDIHSRHSRRSSTSSMLTNSDIDELFEELFIMVGVSSRTSTGLAKEQECITSEEPKDCEKKEDAWCNALLLCISVFDVLHRSRRPIMVALAHLYCVCQGRSTTTPLTICMSLRVWFNVDYRPVLS